MEKGSPIRRFLFGPNPSDLQMQFYCKRDYLHQQRVRSLWANLARFLYGFLIIIFRDSSRNPQRPLMVLWTLWNGKSGFPERQVYVRYLQFASFLCHTARIVVHTLLRDALNNGLLSLVVLTFDDVYRLLGRAACSSYWWHSLKVGLSHIFLAMLTIKFLHRLSFKTAKM